MSAKSSTHKDAHYTADPRVHIGHVHLKVADLERSLSFYAGILGLEVTQRMGDAAAFPLRRRLPPPHRPEHLGKPGRIPASARHHWPLPHRNRLPNSRRLGGCSAKSPASSYSARRS